MSLDITKHSFTHTFVFLYLLKNRGSAQVPDIFDAFQTVTGESIPSGSMYSQLNRIEQRGFVKSKTIPRKELGGDGNNRREISLTDKGVKRAKALECILERTLNM